MAVHVGKSWNRFRFRCYSTRRASVQVFTRPRRTKVEIVSSEKRTFTQRWPTLRANLNRARLSPFPRNDVHRLNDLVIRFRSVVLIARFDAVMSRGKSASAKAIRLLARIHTYVRTPSSPFYFSPFS